MCGLTVWPSLSNRFIGLRNVLINILARLRPDSDPNSRTTSRITIWRAMRCIHLPVVDDKPRIVYSFENIA